MDDITSFLSESWDDIKSPTTSDFTSKIHHLKDLVGSFEQVIDVDRSGITKLRKSIKAMLNSGNVHIENEKIFAESLEKYSLIYEVDFPEILEAFTKFAVVTKEISALMKNLVSNLRNTVMFPLEMFTKTDSKESHVDCKKAFDKAHKDLESKFHKVGKERLRIAESAGLHRKTITGPEVAEDTDRERKTLQLNACEYLLKVNESRSRKGVDLLNHLVEYYQAQASFFTDGMQTIQHFQNYVNGMVPRLKELKARQESERKQLVELRESLKNSLVTYREDNLGILIKAAPMLPLIQSKEVGSEFVGYLLKKSEGKIKKIWQKRKCSIKDGVMYISHSDETKPPVRLNLLTCQAKVIADDPGKKCFDLLSSSNNRTYHFQAEDESDMVRWISVLNNAKEEQLLLAFKDNTGSQGNENLRELQKQLIAEIRKLPGNNRCCDCGAPAPDWLSVNFGAVICLECCGVHRELGVHISRTQSLVIDELGTSQLLIASVMSNQGFNEVMEATLTSEAKVLLIRPDSAREQRNSYIRAKYESRRYAIKTCADTEELKQELYQAVNTCDIHGVLQVFAEQVDLLSSLPGEESGETALHKAIMQENGTSLYIIDFLVQNSDCKRLDVKDMHGNTALHVAADYNQGEAMKLILRANTNLALVKNRGTKTPLDIATENKYHLCIELLQHAIDGKTTLFENVNIDWLLIQDDYVDFSDDDLENQTPEKQRSRPTSMVSELLADRRKISDHADTASLLSISSQRSDRRRTGECNLESEEKYLKEKRATIDRMRRKTTDNVVAHFSSPLSTPSSSSGKGSVKAKLSTHSPYGHSRAVSDHAVLAIARGGDAGTSAHVFKEPTFHSFTTSKTMNTNSAAVSSTAKFSSSVTGTTGATGAGNVPASIRTGSTSSTNAGNAPGAFRTNSPPKFSNKGTNSPSSSVTVNRSGSNAAKTGAAVVSRSGSSVSNSSVAVLSRSSSNVSSILSGQRTRASSNVSNNISNVPISKTAPTSNAVASDSISTLTPKPDRVKATGNSTVSSIVSSTASSTVSSTASSTVGSTVSSTVGSTASSTGVAKVTSSNLTEDKGTVSPSSNAAVTYPTALSVKNITPAPPLAKPSATSRIVSPGTKGIAPPPLPEKRAKPAPGSYYDHALARRSWNGALSVVPPPAQFSIANLANKPTKDSKSVDTSNSKPFANIINKPLTSKPLTPKPLTSKPEPSPRKGSVPAMTMFKSPPPPPTTSKPAIRPKPLVSSISLPIRRRCRALYDCKADNVDELSFFKDEVIVILKSPVDSNWWEGEIDGNPARKGLFPTTHVAVVNDV